ATDDEIEAHLISFVILQALFFFLVERCDRAVHCGVGTGSGPVEKELDDTDAIQSHEHPLERQGDKWRGEQNRKPAAHSSEDPQTSGSRTKGELTQGASQQALWFLAIIG
ncbi:hypothetical protein FOZ63_012097, partial [Perkinsus olseni]